MKLRIVYLSIALFGFAVTGFSKLEPIKLTPEWLMKIESLAPQSVQDEPATERRVLVFTLMTGFQHWATPHTAEVVRILGQKTGAYTSIISDDLSHFEAANIDQYDAIVLINNCSKRPDRHLFFDALGDMEKAVQLEQNLIDFVAGGRGLAVIHGAVVMFNKSEAFGDLVGASFHYHPRQMTVVGKVLDPTHPISRAFGGEDLSHTDEPYCFHGAYMDFNFHPLLELELPELNEAEHAKIFQPGGEPIRRYIAWVKPHGEGRVFYCSPSHNAQSFEDPKLLRFVLNGIQYALGDLEAEDQPHKETNCSTNPANQ